VLSGHTTAGRRGCLAWRFEFISNSNEFKLLQNLSNLDRSQKWSSLV
jgi:hypothetical protein